MFSLNESNRYYLYPYPTDMRKSFYTLSGLVTDQMGKNVRDGDAFIFISRNCASMKILHMEYGRLVIYHMKLEQGYFHVPSIDTEEGRIKVVETFWSDLVMMVQGIDSSKVRRHKRNMPVTFNCNKL